MPNDEQTELLREIRDILEEHLLEYKRIASQVVRNQSRAIIAQRIALVITILILIGFFYFTFLFQH